MSANVLFDTLHGYEPYERIKAGVAEGGIVSVYEMGNAQKAETIAAIAEETGRQVLYLCDSEKTATQVLEDLSVLSGSNAGLFQGREISFYHDVAASREVSCRRLETLSKLMNGEMKMVVAPIDSLLHRVMPRDLFAANTLHLHVGDRIETEILIERLLQAGYVREYMVEGKGQFAVRGGIVDVYPTDASHAVRIEFFDDELDSIREFSVMDQRSVGNLSKIDIPPASEGLVAEERTAQVAGMLRNAIKARHEHEDEQNEMLGGSLAELPAADDDGQKRKRQTVSDETAYDDTREGEAPFMLRSRAAERYDTLLQTAVSQMENGIGTRVLEKYQNLLWDSQESIIDYMTRPVIVVDEPDASLARLKSRMTEFVTAFTNALERGEAIREQEHLILSDDAVLEMLKSSNTVLMSRIQRQFPELPAARFVNLGGVPHGSYGGNTRAMCQDIRTWIETGWRVIVLSGGIARGERMRQSFEDEGINAVFDEHCVQPSKAGSCMIYPLSLSGGFLYPEIRTAVLVESDVYGNKTVKARAKRQEGSKINSFTDLEVGDFVVHDSHGIGKYLGIKRLINDGASRDYLQIEYQGGDKLYIPVDHFDRIQKYIGAGESAAPKLSDLGGKNWRKQKSKVRESLKELAFSLVQLYANRQKKQGHAFAKDTPWQQEFEENFPYEETPDQLIAVEEIKHDMEKPEPMDRLLCGDVGYGKTEVALRAAFKAIMDGYQVAILAPTTILVQQHYQTILRRFEGFPIQADFLSRFKSSREQNETIRRIESGEVDLVVGTHRLLNKGIHFKKLGLLIIDEEQRFGVGHKETIKNVKNSVDVLTLSATPIPRTLHMSMVGIRDMSLLETPPQARYPVQTYVLEYQDAVIRDAILREIGRGGQVFFMYNRVDSIDRCYEELQKLVPEARIVIAHGQMKEDVLEDVMMDFSQQKYDVLLCTTIIESGLDIPSVNTLIVYDAERFGLGQLYQIRGRVGRSNRMAYAYLTVRPGRIISETAQKRLDTIREFTEFGSGFRIAMRDLEIRGAGNILGPQQSGHLADIGYDLYCKLLDEAVMEAQGISPQANREIETRMDVKVNAFLPADYVTGDKQRLEVYRRIAKIDSPSARDDVEEELVDRFGDEPQSVANLVAVAYLKSMCGKLGIDRVRQDNGLIQMYFSADAETDGAALMRAMNKLDPRFTLSLNRPNALVFQDKTKNREDMLFQCVTLMERLTSKMAMNAENQKKS
ncbi:MAG: transcription-repair coupling factor [Clostridia bacterium]|nr:transcription-repair coupling factor [Clostridia bacterium]